METQDRRITQEGYEALKPMFLNTPKEVVEKTINATTLTHLVKQLLSGAPLLQNDLSQ